MPVHSSEMAHNLKAASKSTVCGETPEALGFSCGSPAGKVLQSLIKYQDFDRQTKSIIPRKWEKEPRGDCSKGSNSSVT